MMRMKNLLSHSRNIHVNLTERTVKYSIPICVEKEHMGCFRGIEMKENEIILRFDTLTPHVEIPKESTIVIDKSNKEVSFP
jgi:hypothetical protein